MSTDVAATPRHTTVVLAWLGQPATLIALVVLLVNDHLLKNAWPGWWTGKLSDVAGLVLAPPLVAFVLVRVRRPEAALAVTGVGFILVKSTVSGAAVASAAWGLLWPAAVVRADATDLLALPALGVSWLAWRSAIRHPVASARVRALRMAVVLPLALIGVAATSAPEYPSAIVAGVDGERLVAGEANLYHDRTPDMWSVSDDGGATWVRAPEADEGQSADPARPAAVQQSCSAADCYRTVAGHLRIEHSADGGRSWSVAWQITDRQRAGMLRTYPGIKDVDRDLSSVSIVVQPQPGNGHTVLAANGRDGFVVRHPDGRWERIGHTSTGTGPDPLPEPIRYADGRTWDVLLASLVAVALGFATVSLGCLKAARRLRLSVVWSVLTSLLIGPVALLLSMTFGPTDELIAPALWLMSFVAVMVTAGVSIAQTVRIAARPQTPRAWSGAVLGGGVLSAVLVAGAFALWIGNVLTGVPSILVCAVAGTVPGSVVAWRAARRLAPADGDGQVPDPPYPRAAG